MRQMAQEARRGIEVEFKFELRRKDVRTLLALDAFKGMVCEGPKRQFLQAIYFDTPGLDLSARTITLRVRKEGRVIRQCVKSALEDRRAAAFARNEWEWRIAKLALDAPKLQGDDDVGALFADIDLTTLIPIFSTAITRQTRILKTPDGTLVRCDIDQGRILSGERETTIHEMELELVEGDIAALLDVAKLVSHAVPARLSSRTKAQRGFALYRAAVAPWVRANDVDLKKNATAEDVLSASMTEGLHHLIANEDCVLARAHIEGVHQMRVAFRRMRAAITLFKTHLPKGSFEDLSQALKDAGEALGPARDWDVFAEELLPPVRNDFNAAPELSALAHLAEAQRVRGYAQAQALILSQAYAALLGDVLHWIGHPDVRGAGGVLDVAARDVAHDVLGRLHARVLKSGKGLKNLPTEKRHRLRIAVKKARYATEFFQPLYGTKKAVKYIAALRALQDELGLLNDLAVAERLMQTLCVGARGANAQSLSRATGLIDGWYTYAQSQREETLLKAWKCFSKTKGFW